MATNCGNTNCGCTNTYTVVPPCPPACSEVFNAQCIVYTGTDILCDADTVISRYDYLDTIITKLVNYICNVPETIVEAGENVTVTAAVNGNVTTYTIDSEAVVASLAAGETLITLATTYDPITHITSYEFATDQTVLNTTINDAINAVLLNTTSLFGIDAQYDDITQTLSIEFTGVAVDGVTITGDGTAANPLVAAQGINKYVSSPTTIGPGVSVTFTHNLGTEFITLSGLDYTAPAPYAGYGVGIEFLYTVDDTNNITVTNLLGNSLQNFVLTVIG